MAVVAVKKKQIKKEITCHLKVVDWELITDESKIDSDSVNIRHIKNKNNKKFIKRMPIDNSRYELLKIKFYLCAEDVEVTNISGINDRDISKSKGKKHYKHAQRWQLANTLTSIYGEEKALQTGHSAGAASPS